MSADVDFKLKKVVITEDYIHIFIKNGYNKCRILSIIWEFGKYLSSETNACTNLFS